MNRAMCLPLKLGTSQVQPPAVWVQLEMHILHLQSTRATQEKHAKPINSNTFDTAMLGALLLERRNSGTLGYANNDTSAQPTITPVLKKDRSVQCCKLINFSYTAYCRATPMLTRVTPHDQNKWLGSRPQERAGAVGCWWCWSRAQNIPSLSAWIRCLQVVTWCLCDLHNLP